MRCQRWGAEDELHQGQAARGVDDVDDVCELHVRGVDEQSCLFRASRTEHARAGSCSQRLAR